MGLDMFELFLAEPHLKPSITSLKVEQHIIQTTFYVAKGRFWFLWEERQENISSERSEIGDRFFYLLAYYVKYLK